MYLSTGLHLFMVQLVRYSFVLLYSVLLMQLFYIKKCPTLFEAAQFNFVLMHRFLKIPYLQSLFLSAGNLVGNAWKLEHAQA